MQIFIFFNLDQLINLPLLVETALDLPVFTAQISLQILNSFLQLFIFRQTLLYLVFHFIQLAVQLFLIFQHRLYLLFVLLSYASFSLNLILQFVNSPFQ